ncbi:MAG: SDR family oxidoreductase [Bacteroidota bacterium]
MDLQLKGKSVFISGSTAGIGFGVAKTFLQEGASVIINGRSEKSVDNAIERLKQLFPSTTIEGLACDFAIADQVEQLIEKLTNIDILINNVGIYSSQSFFDTSDQDWKDQLEVNIMSGVRLSKALLPKMIEKDWGRVLFISSECATLVPADLIAYSTTKTALLGISRGLAQLTRGTGVTVNTILPGSTMTEGAEQFLKNLAEKDNKSVAQAETDFFKDIRTSSLLQRFISVEEIANTIVYFSSPLSAATNGSAIKVDGGSMGGILW